MILIRRYLSSGGKKQPPRNFRSRSHLTEMLWRDRYAKGKFGEVEQRSSSISDGSNNHKNNDVREPRRMLDSYCEVIMPFRTDLNLREDYVNHFKGIRFGKILEDLDAMAATIGIPTLSNYILILSF